MPKITANPEKLPDVQSERDFRGRAIEKVGVSNVRYPFPFHCSGVTQGTIGRWEMFASLEADKRGTHMSRFMEILANLKGEQTIDSLVALCEQTRKRLGAADAFLTVEFPWFVEKTAPVTGLVGKLDLDVRIEISCGTVCDTILAIKVPAKSLCPCSKEISEFGAHNQRCELSVEIRCKDGEFPGLSELVQLVEKSASAPVFSVVKRDDEKWITEQAYLNPKFVEDSVRDLAHLLHEEQRIRWFRCSSENFESIHNHNAFAQIESGQAPIGEGVC